MTSPSRSVVVRLAMDTTSYVAGASKAEASTLQLDRAVQKVGPNAATSMERAAKGAGSAETAMGRLNKAAGALGFTLGGLAGVGAAVGVGMSVKWAADYQSALTRLVTTAGEAPKNLKLVSQGFLDMAGQVGISAQELAQAAYTAESAGYHGADTLTVMKAAAQGARQENADLGKVVDAVTTALHDYNLPASDAAKVTSQLITAVSHGKVSFDELTGSMHSVTPLAAALHIPLADIAGDIASMTASGMSADQATQNLADALRHLQNPTSTMTAELAQLGINSTELGQNLGSKGLSGTLQEISQAILQRMGPAGTLMLDALNKSKVASQDLQLMLGQMPPSLAKLSRGLMDGTTSFSDYRKAVQDMGGPSSAMGKQFLSLYENSQGFNQILKSGGPDVQTYTAALQRATGDSAGLSVALQLTGEHAASTNAAIKDVSKAAADAHGNVKGWDEIQGNFNQQMAQTEQGLKSLATEAGQHLLPVLTSAFGYVNRDVIPGIEHLGSGAASAAHGWSQLPGPIKEATAALAGLALAQKIGLLSAVTTRVGALTSGVGALSTAFREEVAMQRWAATIGGITGTTAAAEAGISKMAVAGGLASRAFGSMKAGASSLMGVFGGPWGMAIVGATLGIMSVVDAVKQHDAAVKKATQDVIAWDKAISLGGSGQTAVQAAQHLDNLRQKIAAVQEQLSGNHTTLAALHPGGASGQTEALQSRLADLRKELNQGSAAWNKQLAAMTPVQEAQARVDIATQDLTMAQKHNADNSPAVTNAAIRLQAAQALLAGETDRANAAAKTQIQRMQDQATKALGLVDAQRAAKEASLNLTQQISDYNQGLADGTLKGTALQQAQLSLVDSAEQVAKAASDAAAKQAQQNGATDTGAASQAAFLKSLQDTAGSLTGPAKAAVEQMITQLGGQKTAAELAAGAINGLGITVTDLPNEHFIQIDAPTDTQMQKLHDLGYATVTLPNGKVVVTADTNPAIGEIQDLLNYARQQSILYRATLPSLVDNSVASGSGRPGLATGGWVRGPGGPTSDSVALWGSNGEFMVKADRAKENASLLEAINSGAIRGFASGGWIGVPPGGWYAGTAAVPTHVQDAGYKAGISQYLQQQAALMSPYAGMVLGATSQQAVQMGARMAAAYGWNGPQFMALFNLWMRESGWNPYAVNKSSGAYGIPQSLGHGHPYNLGDIAAQETWGMNYIASRYGTPANAWAHETRYGWYDQGGTLAPGITLAMNGTGKPETVRTSEQEATLQKVLRSREVTSSSGGGGASGDALLAVKAIAAALSAGDFAGIMVKDGGMLTLADPDAVERASRQGTRRALAFAGLGR